MQRKAPYQQVITIATNLAQEDYYIIQFNAGMRYLHHYVRHGNAEVRSRQISEISKTAIYWMWWVNQWNLRDAEFLRQYALDEAMASRLTDELRNELRALYYEQHAVETMIAYPGQVVKRLIKAELSNHLTIK